MPAAPAPDAAVFAEHFSLEATRPTAAEIAALADIVPPATPVYFSAVPTITRQEIIAAAASLRKAGLEPIIHVAARRLASAADLQELLSGLRGEADVRLLLVIGGDVDTPGPFADALAVIQKGHLRETGIEEIGIGAYPDGHPRIPAGRLESALDEKIAAATAQGLRVHIVSQFSFSPERIVAWLRQLRAGGIGKPIKIGMAGPTSVPALLRYARRCGVTASLRGLASGVASGLVGHVGPDRIIETLSGAGDLGEIAPHYFSFGGTLETARYACEAAAGRNGASRAMARSN
ncbi:MAG TPA: methylenetetrahydrofolate reductase [Xanthobacteraceae bacterium]|nr:methylenetetrahydrofolate reductase [Xanthobacteraceae bacterium]